MTTPYVASLEREVARRAKPKASRWASASKTASTIAVDHENPRSWKRQVRRLIEVLTNQHRKEHERVLELEERLAECERQLAVIAEGRRGT